LDRGKALNFRFRGHDWVKTSAQTKEEKEIEPRKGRGGYIVFGEKGGAEECRYRWDKTKKMKLPNLIDTAGILIVGRKLEVHSLRNTSDLRALT